MLAPRRSVRRTRLRERTGGRLLRMSSTGAATGATAASAGGEAAGGAVRAGFATEGAILRRLVRGGPYTGLGDAPRSAEPALPGAAERANRHLRLRRRRARRPLPAVRRRPRAARPRRRLPLGGADPRLPARQRGGGHRRRPVRARRGGRARDRDALGRRRGGAPVRRRELPRR